VRAESLASQLDAALEKMPQVRGGSGQYMGERAARGARARPEAGRVVRTSTSRRALLVAIAQDREGAAGHALAAVGVTTDAIFKALVTCAAPSASPIRTGGQVPGAAALLEGPHRRRARGKLDPVIGRDEEIRRVIQVLSRRTKNNPVLIGEPGVGKTAIVEGLAQRIVAGDVPEGLKDKRLVALELAAVFEPATMPAMSRATSRCPWTLRHVAGHDALREPLDDGRLADAGLADQHGVVLRAPREHLDDAPISSSRPMTGSSLPRRAASVRSFE